MMLRTLVFNFISRFTIIYHMTFYHNLTQNFTLCITITLENLLLLFVPFSITIYLRIRHSYVFFMR